MAASTTLKTISATEASNRFGSVLEEAASGQSLIIVTRNGKSRAVILGIDDYIELMEQLETAMDLEDDGLVKKIAAARNDYRLGRTLTLEELDQEFGFTDKEQSGDK